VLFLGDLYALGLLAIAGTLIIDQMTLSMTYVLEYGNGMLTSGPGFSVSWGTNFLEIFVFGPPGPLQPAAASLELCQVVVQSVNAGINYSEYEC